MGFLNKTGLKKTGLKEDWPEKSVAKQITFRALKFLRISIALQGNLRMLFQSLTRFAAINP